MGGVIAVAVELVVHPGGGGKIGGYWTVLGSSGQVAGQPYMGRKEGEKVG